MVDILFQIGVAKLVVSALLAGVAWAVQRRWNHPTVAHSAWLVVLVALLLPAVVALPVLPGGAGAAAEIAGDAGVAAEAAARVEFGPASSDDVGSATSLSAGITGNGKAALAIAWLVVAAVILGWTLARALRFRRWLKRTLAPAPPELRHEVVELGHRLDLARMPKTHTTSARVSPMVYWAGGKARLVIPTFLLASLDRRELRAVLAHELAHVRRRDHMVRWVEWLACSAFWWNPVAWWARRELRAAEEASCDAFGATAAESTPRAYATSLLRVVELLSRPPTPPTPAFASGVGGGRNRKSLERRLRMLISGRSSVQPPRWMRLAGTAAAVCLLPLGLLYCGFADQPIPTALDDAAESPSLAGSEVPATAQPEITELRYWNVEGPPTVAAADGPVLAYVILTASETIGPHALATAPGLPQECRLDSISIDACSSAMKADVKLAAGLRAWGVCVGDLVPSSWDGKCLTWYTSPFRLVPVFAEILSDPPQSKATAGPSGSML